MKSKWLMAAGTDIQCSKCQDISWETNQSNRIGVPTTAATSNSAGRRLCVKSFNGDLDIPIYIL